MQKHIFKNHEIQIEEKSGHDLDFPSIEEVNLDEDKCSEPPIKRRKARKDGDINIIDTMNKITNEDILDFFTNDQKGFLNFLKGIFNEKPFDRRHYLLVNKGITDFGANSEIRKLQNITFLKDNGNIDTQLNDITLEIFDKIKEKFKFNTQENNFRSNYAKYAILPIGIIYFLATKFRMKFNQAEHIYITYSAPIQNMPQAQVIQGSSVAKMQKFTEEIQEEQFDEIPDFV